MESALLPAMYEDVAQLRQQLGRKFEAQDLQYGEYSKALMKTVNDYLDTYTGNFEYVKSVIDARNVFGGVTPNQAKGILNCIVAEQARVKVAPTNYSPADAVNPTGFVIPDGRYTVVRTNGNYHTLRLKTLREDQYTRYGKPAGTRIISYLCGPDNSSDYMMFGWVFPDGHLQPKGDYKNDSYLMEDGRLLLTMDRDGALNSAIAYAKRSGRCSICGADLTNPDSIEASMGPICRGKFGY